MFWVSLLNKIVRKQLQEYNAYLMTQGQQTLLSFADLEEVNQLKVISQKCLVVFQDAKAKAPGVEGRVNQCS